MICGGLTEGSRDRLVVLDGIERAVYLGQGHYFIKADQLVFILVQAHSVQPIEILRNLHLISGNLAELLVLESHSDRVVNVEPMLS